ncbi:hemerythrin domain-containing protein [Mycobacterium sp. M1]|uniref:Hemerythrin domain-containing protein n=1 Tax=Mycolicibacter acidiphilus TaxID=2835306 RepID=A0ABS5RM41_9MYCO|nr:hemerythrin domain-containing protein [Mycolicibacter acidiphilus]MBS9535259.1 hemerythrin domain-containing protein [Mycolicibacter acidiphilus]
MAEQPLSAALEHEHQEIDAGIAAFLAKLDGGTVDTDLLSATVTALRRHIYLEEQILFPPISKGAQMMSVFGMIRGHGEIWRTLDVLETQADSAALRDSCDTLLRLLADHNKVEEPVIYPAADTGLDPQTAAQLADFLADGVMPAGWVCAKAAG